MAELSILIVNYNSGAYLEKCLASIRRFSVYGEWEVCVIDNASTDPASKKIRSKFTEVKWIQNEKNLGFAAAVNRGLSATSAPYVLWLNPDSELLDGGFHDLIQYFKEHPDTGVLGAQLLNPGGSVQISGRSFPSYETALFNRYSLLTRFFPKNPGSQKYLNLSLDRSRIQEVDWVSGACLMHRRDLVEKLGPVDEGYFMYCEDVDFCRRVKEAGLKVYYHPGALVLHHIGGSSRTVRRRMILQHHQSMWHYYKKFYKRNPLKDAAVGAGILGRMGVKLLFPS